MVSALRSNEERSPGYRPDLPPEAKPAPEAREPAPHVESAPVPETAQTENTLPSERTVDSTIDLLRSKLRRSRRPVQVPQVRDALTRNVEAVMSEGLEDVFRELTPVQQQEFKIKGEQTAQAIRQLLTKTKIKIREIFKLILEWLQMLPGVNKYFLEQEAKIRAEKIIALKHFDVTDKK
jgi:hypothetical protein